MKKILFVALTTILLTTNITNANAKNKALKNNKAISNSGNNEIPISDNFDTNQNFEEVQVDYIIMEDGKAYVTYIYTNNDILRNEVIQFIESTTYNNLPSSGKIYSMTLTLKK